MPTICRRRLIASRAAFVVLLVSGAGRGAARDTPDDMRRDSVCILTIGKASPPTAIRIPGYSHFGSPSFSKDSEWIAFDAYKPDNEVGDCWLARRDGSDPKLLTRGGTAPRWSPDSRRLLFTRETKADRPAGGGVFVIHRDGSGERRLCDGRWPDWSPDGKRIVYSRGGRGESGGARPRSRVYIARDDGTSEKLLADGNGPTWSPDGRSIACCQMDPTFPAPILRVVDVRDGSQRILGYGWFRANWSPDSRYVVSNGTVGPERVGMIRRAASGPNAKVEPILPGSRGLSPCLSPDGKQIIFVTNRAEEERIQP